MSLRENPLGELKVPLTWTAGIVFIVVFITSVAILLTEGRKTYDTDANGVARTVGDRVMAPVGTALSAPGRWTGAGVDSVRGYFFAVSENRRLKAELKDMRQWREVALALRDTNERYRTVLGLKTDPPIPMATALIVTDSRGPFANSRLANAGSEKGIHPGNPVMSENGLVGRVTGVTQGVSRVLMLTDAASRTPVMVDRTNARAILTGDGGPNPRLEYLRGQDPVKEGDRILTSGDGGIFPRGLPVGYAVKGLDGRWRVVLASDKAPIDYVRILLFEDFTQVANRVALDKVDVPPPTPGVPPSNTPVGQMSEPVAPPAAAAAAASAKTPGAVDAAKAAPVAAKPQASAEKAAATKPAPDKKPADAKPAGDKATTASKPAAKPAPGKTAVAGSKDSASKPATSKPAPDKPSAAKPAAAKPADKAAATKSKAPTTAPAKPAPKKPETHETTEARP